MKPKVTIVVIAPIDPKLKTDRKAFLSALTQDYENFDVINHFEKPEDHIFLKEDTPFSRAMNSIAKTYWNCSKNREIARKLALNGDAEYFLFKDWDIVLPKDAISNFMKQAAERFTTVPYKDQKTGDTVPAGQPLPKRHIQGGWYPIYYHRTKVFAKWPAGKWIDNKKFTYYREKESSLVYTHLIGLGCALISREALANTHFEHGLDIEFTNESGNPMRGGECLAFANCALDNGYELAMNGDVVCEHIKKGPSKWITYFQWMLRRKTDLLKQKSTRLRSRIMSAGGFRIQKQNKISSPGC